MNNEVVRLLLKTTLGSLLVGLGVLVSGCGDAPTSNDTASRPDRPYVLELHGSPYEMGLQHGRVLRNEIQLILRTWRKRMLEETLGSTRGRDPSKGPIRDLDEFIDMLVDQSELWLPKRIRSELRGLAEGCGVAEEELLRLEFMRDALRYMGMGTGLSGAVAARATSTCVHARVWWSGHDVSFMRRHLLLLHRKPTGEMESVTLAWPGALGGLAGIREDGLAYALAQLPVRNAESSGFGGGQTFALAARVAHAESKSVGELFARIKGTVGHVLLVVRHESDPSWTRLEGIAGPALYAATPHTPQVISPRDDEEPDSEIAIAMGPFEDVHDPRAAKLQAHTARNDLQIDTWFDTCASFADGDASTPFVGIGAVIQSARDIVSLGVAGGPAVTLMRSNEVPIDPNDGKSNDHDEKSD